MFNFSKKKPTGKSAVFNIVGMHCASCAMNIDGELEDSQGIISASTSYATATTKVEYDELTISPDEIKVIIKRLGYQVDRLNS